MLYCRDSRFGLDIPSPVEVAPLKLELSLSRDYFYTPMWIRFHLSMQSNARTLTVSISKRERTHRPCANWSAENRTAAASRLFSSGPESCWKGHSWIKILSQRFLSSINTGVFSAVPLQYSTPPRQIKDRPPYIGCSAWNCWRLLKAEQLW